MNEPSIDLFDVIIPHFLPPALSSEEERELAQFSRLDSTISFMGKRYHKYEVEEKVDTDTPFAKLLQDLFLFWAEVIINETDVPVLLSQLMYLDTLEDVPRFDKSNFFYGDSVKQLMLNVGFAFTPAPANKLFSYLSDLSSSFECKASMMDELFEGDPTALTLKPKQRDLLVKKWREGGGLASLDTFYGWETPASSGEFVQAFNDRMNKELSGKLSGELGEQTVTPFSNFFVTFNKTSKLLKQRFVESRFWDRVVEMTQQICGLESGWMCLKAFLRLILLGLISSRESSDFERINNNFRACRAAAEILQGKNWKESASDILLFLRMVDQLEEKILNRVTPLNSSSKPSNTKSMASEEQSQRYQELYKAKYGRIMEKIAQRQSHYRSIFGIKKGAPEVAETKEEGMSAPASASKEGDKVETTETCVISNEPISVDKLHYLMADLDIISLKRMAEHSFLQSLTDTDLGESSEQSETKLCQQLRIVAASGVAKLNAAQDLGFTIKTCNHVSEKIDSIRAQQPIVRELKEYKFCPLCRAGFNMLIPIAPNRGYPSQDAANAPGAEYQLLSEAWAYLSSQGVMKPSWIWTDSAEPQSDQAPWAFFFTEFQSATKSYLSLSKKIEYDKSQVLDANSYSVFKTRVVSSTKSSSVSGQPDEKVTLAESVANKDQYRRQLQQDISRMEEEAFSAPYAPVDSVIQKISSPEGLLKSLYTGLFETSEVWGFGKTAKTLGKSYWALTCVDRSRRSWSATLSPAELLCLGKPILYLSRPDTPEVLQVLKDDGLMQEDLTNTFCLFLVGLS